MIDTKPFDFDKIQDKPKSGYNNKKTRYGITKS